MHLSWGRSSFCSWWDSTSPPWRTGGTFSCSTPSRKKNIFYFFKNETGKKTKELFKENYNCHLRSINQSLGLFTSLFLNYPPFLITTRTIKKLQYKVLAQRGRKRLLKKLLTVLCVSNNWETPKEQLKCNLICVSCLVRHGR